MTQMQALPTAEDYRRYDRVWQRVSPVYDPYPEVRRGGEQPGADETELLRGLLRRAIGDRQVYRCLTAQAPCAADRRAMAALKAEAGAEARTLQAAYFLRAGETYCVTVVLPPQPKLPWRDALRRRWQEENAASAQCAGGADSCADPALSRLLRRLSESAACRADRIQSLLEAHIC